MTITDDNGWICWNSGPGGWFWFKDKLSCEHELSDDIRPATALEKLLMNSVGNSIGGDLDYVAGLERALSEYVVLGAGKCTISKAHADMGRAALAAKP